jgi:hypothetical protein
MDWVRRLELRALVSSEAGKRGIVHVAALGDHEAEVLHATAHSMLAGGLSPTPSLTVRCCQRDVGRGSRHWQLAVHECPAERADAQVRDVFQSRAGGPALTHDVPYAISSQGVQP